MGARILVRFGVQLTLVFTLLKFFDELIVICLLRHVGNYAPLLDVYSVDM